MSLDLDLADPIFIQGILPRSGTNFLYDLLLAHPDCRPGRSPISEPLFLDHADILEHFVTKVRRSWDPMWGEFDDALMADFRASLGDGLISFLWVERDRRLLVKSPSVNNLSRFFVLFPRARLVILVRDGRSVVESCRKTFGWHFERASRMWAGGAEEIRAFESSHSAFKDRYALVRYEDLLDALEPTLSPVMDHLGLDSHMYDYKAAARLPVRGSAFYHGPVRTDVHWDPVERGPDFDPRARWGSWTPEMHERFEWIAGHHLRYFGYESLVRPIVEAPRVGKHRALDLAWSFQVQGRQQAYRLRGRLGTATRPIRERLGLVRMDR
jgi:protein-tyrosine sulfotransferase